MVGIQVKGIIIFDHDFIHPWFHQGLSILDVTDLHLTVWLKSNGGVVQKFIEVLDWHNSVVYSAGASKII